MNHLIIEQYKPEYHPIVIDIITSIQQKEFNLPITYQDQPDLAQIETFYDSFLVALHNTIPVGTIGFKRIQDFAIIRKMFVTPNFRGSTFGTAQKLLETLEKQIAAESIKKIYLGTTDFFKAAHRFYERNNYIEIAQTDLPAEFPRILIDTKFYHKVL